MKTRHVVILTLLVTVLVFLLPQKLVSAQTTQYDFQIWPMDQIKFPGYWETIEGKICPSPAPDAHTNQSMKIKFGLPSWAATEAGTPQFVREFNKIPLCDQPQKIAIIRPNYTGIYPINATAQWIQNGKTITAQSNNTQFEAIQPCDIAYNVENEKTQYYLGQTVRIKVENPEADCYIQPAQVTLKIFDATHNDNNLVYQETRQIAKWSIFNYTLPTSIQYSPTRYLPKISYDDNRTGNVIQTGSYFYSADPTKQSYELQILSQPSVIHVGTLPAFMIGKMCPFFPPADDHQLSGPDPNTGWMHLEPGRVTLQYHFVGPNGLNMTSTSGGASNMDCNDEYAEQSGNVLFNSSGTWSVYFIATWTEKNFTHSIQSKTINFTVTGPSFQTTMKKLLDSSEFEKFAQLSLKHQIHWNPNYDPFFTSFQWSPDSKAVFFTVDNVDAVWSINMDGSNLQRLNDSIPTSTIFPNQLGQMMVTTNPCVNCPSRNMQLETVDGSYTQTLFTGNSYPFSPAISSDGRFIVFGSNPDPWNTNESRGIYLIELSQPIPEFPFTIPILLASTTSLIVFYRMKFRK